MVGWEGDVREGGGCMVSWCHASIVRYNKGLQNSLIHFWPVLATLRRSTICFWVVVVVLGAYAFWGSGTGYQ